VHIKGLLVGDGKGRRGREERVEDEMGCPKSMLN